MRILITSNQQLAKYRGKMGKIHHKNIELFLDSIYAEYLSDIDMIVDMGNIFANPSKLSTDSLRIFIKFINNSKDLPIFLLQGNNDVKGGENVIQEIFDDVFDNVYWVTTYRHDTISRLAFLPCQTGLNHEKALDYAKDGEGRYLFAHLTVAGDVTNLQGYNRILIGNHDNPNQIDSVDFLGSTHHHEEIDMDQPRGAHILDTETNILTSIPNNHKWLHTFDDLPPNDFDPENKVITLKVPHFKYETACKYANDHTNPFTICNVVIDYENTQEKDVSKVEQTQTFNDYLASRIDEIFSHDPLSNKILESIR